MGCGGSKGSETSNQEKQAEKSEEPTNSGEAAKTDSAEDPAQTAEDKTKDEGQDSSPAEGFTKFQTEALNRHNEHRANHSAEPLVLSKELCDMAQNWADHLVKEGKFEHSSHDYRKLNGEHCGENIAGGISQDGDHTGDKPTDMWYAEVKDYDYSAPGFVKGTGHFTQVVWKGSKQLGMGISEKPKGDNNYHSYVIVGVYCPAGNYADQFEENVAPCIEG